LDKKQEKMLLKNVNGLKESVDKVEYCNKDQHDSQEFLARLLDKLHSELNIIIEPIIIKELDYDITSKNVLECYDNWKQENLL